MYFQSLSKSELHSRSDRVYLAMSTAAEVELSEGFRFFGYLWGFAPAIRRSYCSYHELMTSLGLNLSMLLPSSPVRQQESSLALPNLFLHSVLTRVIRLNMRSSFVFVKGVISNNSIMCKTSEHSFFTSLFMRILAQMSRYFTELELQQAWDALESLDCPTGQVYLPQRNHFFLKVLSKARLDHWWRHHRKPWVSLHLWAKCLRLEAISGA